MIVPTQRQINSPSRGLRARGQRAVGLLLLPLASVCAVLNTTSAVAAPFDELTPQAQAAVVERCLPVRYDSGVAAWRDCVESEATAEQARSAAANTPSLLDSLSLDERFALQKHCGGTDGAQCRANALAELARVPKPVTDDLREDEQHALARA